MNLAVLPTPALSTFWYPVSQYGAGADVSFTVPASASGLSFVNSGTQTGVTAVELSGGAAVLAGNAALSLPSTSSMACFSNIILPGDTVSFAMWVWLDPSAPIASSDVSVFSVATATSCACAPPPP